MIIAFDKNLDANIQSVVSGDITGEIFYWQSETANGWLIDNTNFKIRLGADDTTINFTSAAAMLPYITQMTSMGTIHNPVIDGINLDPFYDNPKTGTIQPHTYVDTDIEQDLIDGTV